MAKLTRFQSDPVRIRPTERKPGQTRMFPGGLVLAGRARDRLQAAHDYGKVLFGMFLSLGAKSTLVLPGFCGKR